MNKPVPPEPDASLDIIILNEVQLLLSEKRTSLSALRTGSAIFAFPLSVLSVLITTSGSYEWREVMHWLVPLLVLTLGLTGLAVYLIAHSFRRLHHYDRIINELKRKHSKLAEFLD